MKKKKIKHGHGLLWNQIAHLKIAWENDVKSNMQFSSDSATTIHNFI